jgi:hypothetical protein
MACCAIAFFLVSQILWPLRWIRARLPIAIRNDTVSWSPGDAAPRQSVALASTGALVLTAALMLGSINELTAHSQLCSAHVARGN